MGAQAHRRRPLQRRPRVPRRRRRPCASAQRRARHEHRHPGCLRSRLEARRDAAGLGRAGAARELRPRAAAGLARAPRRCRSPTTAASSAPRQRAEIMRRRRPGRRRGARSARGWWRRTRSPGTRSACTSATSTIRRRSWCRTERSSPPTTPSAIVPTAFPGARAPHAWLADGRSILDLFGDGFVLLHFADVPTEALETAAAARGVPLTVHRIEHRGDRRPLRPGAGAGAARRPRRLARRPAAARMRWR